MVDQALGMRAGSGGVTEVLAAQRAPIIAEVTGACLAAVPALMQRLGASAVAAVAEDVGWHLDFLVAALDEEDPDAFADYLAWHAQVAASRGQSDATLHAALAALGDALTRRLGAEAAPAAAVLDAGQARLAAGAPAPTYDRQCPLAWGEAGAFAEALLAGDRRGATSLFDRAWERAVSLPDAEVHLVQPAMYDVGRRWQRNEVSVAQEHLATAIAQTLMAQALGRSAASAALGRSALLACPAGNHHTLGLRMVADALETSGWTVYYLGANTPLDALVTQAQALAPDLVALSASLPHHLRPLREAVAALRGRLGPACPPVGIGGLVFNQFPGLARGVGAPLLGTHALDAVAQAKRLVGH